MKYQVLKKCSISQILIFGLFICRLYAQNVVDATTMTNKVMAGYQGWFRTPGDRFGNETWAHLFNGAQPAPAKLGFDTWPDMSELTSSEKYAVPGFSYADGKPAYLYSAQNYKTVLRHFQWMKQYGIDGVWLSEFCGHFPGGAEERDSATVLRIMDNVQRAATTTGRTWAFMWDMSGLSPRLSKAKIYHIIIDQWKKMVDEGVTTDARYMHQNGKPVLLLWGFFPDRPASQPEYMNAVIDFLQTPGKYQCTLIGGTEPNWRAQGTPGFQAMLMRMQGLQPWSVGRRITDPATGYAVQNTALWAGDIAKCKANGVMFMPVFNAGTHIAGPPPNPPAGPTVPRRMGNYLWEQFVKASQIAGVNSAFIAMFDEINEGTQIMKIDIHPPVQAPFLTYDGATADYYLRLVGAGAKLLKAGNSIAPIIPISPFDSAKYYKIKNYNSGVLLGSVIGLNNHNDTTADMWQIIFDNAGYFSFKNKASGKWLQVMPDKKIEISASSLTDNAKWHLEWDGTGNCRLVNKATQTAIDKAGNLRTDAAVDDLRWQIIPQ